jgi:hypothetical protein
MGKKNTETRKSKSKTRKKILERINPNAAGIDIGANFHFAAIPEDCTEGNVRKFGPFTNDLHQLADWLTEHRIKTVVMESTGVYWIPVFQIKHLAEFLNQKIETVITVCGNTDQACPMFPGQVNRYHWGFDDPAHAVGSEEEVLSIFRRTRDEMLRIFEAYGAGRNNERTKMREGL